MKATSQRDFMRELFAEFGGSKNLACAAYAQAEQDGTVVRNRNQRQTSALAYALALWEDGLQKGWLTLVKPSDTPDESISVSSTTIAIDTLSVAELLALHAAIGEQLRERGIVRSANNPTGDLAEFLFCRAFGWEQASNSKRGYDAKGHDGILYQIKGRRLHRRNMSRQLSAIRDIEGGHFHVLAGVLFDENFNVIKAALIPAELVVARSTFVARTNSNRFILHDDVWVAPGVTDVTEQIRAAMPEGL